MIFQAFVVSVLVLLLSGLPYTNQEALQIAGTKRVPKYPLSRTWGTASDASTYFWKKRLASPCAGSMVEMDHFGLSIAADVVDSRANFGEAEGAYLGFMPSTPDYRICLPDSALAHARRWWPPSALSETGGEFETSQMLPVALQSPETKSSEDKARLFASMGFDSVDGWWFDNEYKHKVGAAEALLYAKSTAWNGFIPRMMVTNRQAGTTSTLTLGRNQDKDFLVYDQAELVLEVGDRPTGILSTSVSYSLSGGWFRQPAVTAETSRLQYVVGVTMPTVALTAKTSWEATASWQDAVYGTRMRQSVLRLDGTYTIVLDEQSSLKLSYDRLGVFGATPFNFDAIDPKFITNDLSFESFRTVVRAEDVTTTFHYGILYSFLDQTPSLVVGYKEDVPTFPWGVDVEYDLISKDTEVKADSKFPIGLGTNFSVHATYHTSTGQFDALDYLLTSHLFDCANLEVQYRQIKQEFSLEIDMRPCDP